MATNFQIQANRTNSEKSTGPITGPGKVISSQNRRAHGLSLNSSFMLLMDEDRDEFQQLFDALHNEYSPTGATELLLVERMAQHHWLRDRALRSQCDSMTNHGRIMDERLFTLYLRYETAHERAFHKCLTELLKLRAEKRRAEIGFEREKRSQASHPLELLVKKAAVAQRFSVACKALPADSPDRTSLLTDFCTELDVASALETRQAA